MDELIKTGEVLAPYTTLHIGGIAEYFVRVETPEELRAAIAWAKDRNVPYALLAGGSNVLVPDEGITGLVIQCAISGTYITQKGSTTYVTAGAGEEFDALVAETVAQGFWGLENLSGIPGSVGATPVQNVGAYGVEVKDRIASVVVYDTVDDVFRILLPKECAFRYRDSLFKREAGLRYIVVWITFMLTTTERPVLEYRDLALRISDTNAMDLQMIRDTVLAIRSEKFPDWSTVGTAGSFFKNPIITKEHFIQLQEKFPELPGFETEDGVKVSLGWILDQVLHLKGTEDHGVGLYQNQALVLVAHPEATEAHVRAFAERISTAVFQNTEIVIEWEVTQLATRTT